MPLTTRLILDVGALAVDHETLGQRFSLGTNGALSAIIPDSNEAFNVPEFTNWKINAFGHVRGFRVDSRESLHSRYTFAIQSRIQNLGDDPVPVVAAIGIDFKLKEGRAIHRDTLTFPSDEAAWKFDTALTKFVYEKTPTIVNFVRHIRAKTAQHWLDTEDHPTRILWPAFFVDEQGVMLPLSRAARWGTTSVDLSATGYKRAATNDDLQSAALAATTAPEIADLMLLDADHWARFGYEFNPNNERTILYAAMAAELSVKRATRKNVTGQCQSLIKKLVESKSSTLPTIEYYHSVCLAVFERSYHNEYPDHFTRLQSLFEARNAYVHSGTVKLKQPLERYIETAIHAVNWLGQVVESASDTERSHETKN